MAKELRDFKGRFVKGHKSIDDGKTRFKKGHKPSEETKEKLRLSRIGNKSTLGKRGKDANNWKGGKTSESRKRRSRIEWKEWRQSVYERDDWTCQNCLKSGVHLHPHHILNHYSNIDLVYEIDNGITFCKDCHYMFHSKYGFKNNNEEQVKDFIGKGGY